MFVIRLPNGNLKVPRTATGNDGRIIGDVYVEIGPQDADYARLAAQALTAEEVAQRRERWRQDDEALRQEFLEFARRNSDYPWPDSGDVE
jgi:membrane protein involved in colicin uptake